MAVTISNIKGLDYDGITLVSAFAPNAISFDVDGAPSGYYCEVTFNGVIFFKCTNIIGDSWVLDYTEIMKSLIGASPTTVTTEGLITDVYSLIIVRDSSGNNIAQQYPTNSTSYLCFGYPKRGVTGGMSFVNSLPKYHNGKYSLYDGDGSFSILTGKTDKIYRNINGYEIAWINSEGGWSFWNFRLISQKINTNNSNEVSYYALRNADAVMSSYDMDSDTTSELSFDTVAVDSIHFGYLTEIQRSKRIIYDGRVYRVKSISDTTAANRQNLHFSITLETKENA
jgi:hypothetical protein